MLASGSPSGKFAGLALKAFVIFEPGTATIRKSNNITSVTRTAAGDYAIVITSAMQSVNFVMDVGASWSNASLVATSDLKADAAVGSTTSFVVKARQAGVLTDPLAVYVGCYE